MRRVGELVVKLRAPPFHSTRLEPAGALEETGVETEERPPATHTGAS